MLCKRPSSKEKHRRPRAQQKTEVVKRRAGYKGCCKGHAAGKAKYLQIFGQELDCKVREAPAQRGLISLRI